MGIRGFSFFVAVLLGLSTVALGANADEKAATKKDQKAKVEAVKTRLNEDGTVQTEKVVVSQGFLARWQRIQVVTRQRAFEIQQTRSGAGVRGQEGTDGMLKQLYYQGKGE